MNVLFDTIYSFIDHLNHRLSFNCFLHFRQLRKKFVSLTINNDPMADEKFICIVNTLEETILSLEESIENRSSSRTQK